MSSKVPGISVLMPIRNAEEFLSECLSSIVSQTEPDWELIAVNDHSTDCTTDILQAYAKQDKRIITLENEGSGIIDALRMAYAHSQGQLITRMDADDLMAPEKLKTLGSNLLQAGSGHVAIGMVRYFGDGLKDGYLNYERWLNDLTAQGTNFNDIYRECVIPSPCWMVFREDLERCGAFSPNVYPEDYDLCFRFYANGLAPIACNDVLHLWRDHPERSSRTDLNYADNRFLNLKLHWFLKLDHRTDRPLILWGAGAKGKQLAKLLTEADVPFEWICNNPNKIGKEIHSKVMRSPEYHSERTEAQVIIAVANPSEQLELKQLLGGSCFFFC